MTNDHLDWHGNHNNYLNAKLKIFFLQNKNQYAFINIRIKKFFLERNFSSKIIIPKKKDINQIKNKIKNNYLSSNTNDENMNFVYAFSKLLNIKKKSFISSMESFKGLPHRFELFLQKKNISFINDSKATSFSATKTAISSLRNIYWILGGLPKKGDKIKLYKYKKNIVKCYLIGKNTKFFKKQIEGKIHFSITKNLKNSIQKILRDIKLQNHSHCNILLSPAAASFDQFSNFEKRGETFKKLSKKYVGKLI